ncbi:very short patch repair endonuclease [Novosphingobium organovorum]|uniref:very short patch repair endonuclease n=1 Tax=Novosphingobium organovorum TaxID=2930092 RepID=UPI00389959FB
MTFAKPAADVSERMRGIRRTGTTAELVVGATLRELGLSYRKNVKALPGSPDFANQRRRWAIFVNGCFWHHHTGCRRATVPKSNAEFWTEKFLANRRRDARAIRSLRSRGYNVLVIWECQNEGLHRRLQRSLKRVA